ncbi:DnaT-like ssDNA-binding protein [Rhodosalinus sediminis]|uniref:DnaT-like ssDNA-binding protein n=1 Tax=Rhodosalinus sediminis TaxID=1940533 RepID=UPI0023563349|nr:DnaT-like ssDNA-binding protein [Rhodosalinus sediminis]
MTLTVEDGSGRPDADAFVTVAVCDAYHAARGRAAWAAATEEAREQAIRRATAYLSTAIGWKGRPRRPRKQALAWPRVWVTDGEGYSVATDRIPPEIAQATAEVALRELERPGAMTPDYTPNAREEAVQIGPISVRYAEGAQQAEGARPILLVVRDLAGGLMRTGVGHSAAGTATRA